MSRNFELQECVIFVQSTKIDIHENKLSHQQYPNLVRLVVGLL